jgi:nitrate/TMAO reductase-like tetraheme cytochrome c subunit
LKRLALILGGLAVIGGGGLVGAEYYTSRPQFCGTCHVMDPYYRSWSRDEHSYKHGAWCVDCHYAPGEQHTIKAKFKGLSQVASYFSGRYGAARPRAHVNDASCLTAPCHGDRKYLPKSLLIGEPRTEKRYVAGRETEVQRNPTVHFVHEKHLRIPDKLAETEGQLETVAHRVEAAAPGAYARILAAAQAIPPAAERESKLRALMEELQLGALVPEALELMRLEHLRTRLRQLAGLTCAACHGYDASGEHHVQPADLQTCFTCHFTHQAFNRDTGECLKCHEPPVRQILVHDQFVSLSFQQPAAEGGPSTQPVLMDHRDIVNRKIDCASCHFDVIQGEAAVNARDCTRCHDQQKYHADFEKRTTESVAEYHRQHVAAQRARCADCHRTIQHRLIDVMHVASSADYLQPVLNDCQHCHPDHHGEQVKLLMGVGGVGVTRAMPNAMFGSRINCRACHIKSATDLKGDDLIKATEDTCIACHGADYERLFQQWRNEIDSYLKEAEDSLARVERQMDDWRSRGATVPEDVKAAFDEARANVQFIRAGNGIHNKNYALKLLDVSIGKLDEAVARLMPK